MKQFLTSLCLTFAVLLGSAGVSWSDESNAGPSFDCDKASTPTEHAICASDKLKALDFDLRQVYEQAQISVQKDEKKSRQLLADQRQWNKARKTSCSNLYPECLIPLYKERIKHLRGKFKLTEMTRWMDNGTVSVWFRNKEQQEIMSFGNDSIYFGKEKFGLNDIIVLNHRPQGNYFCVDGIPADYETLDRKGPFWDGPASKHDTFPFFADDSPSIAIMYYYAGGTGWGWYDLYFFDTSSTRYVKFSNIPCGNFPEILVDGSRILSLTRDNTYLFGPRNFSMAYPRWFVVKGPDGKVSTELTAKINYERIVKDISFSDYDLTLLRKIGKAVESPDYDSKGISLFSEDEKDAVRESLAKFFQSLLYYNLSNNPFPETDGDPALTALASKILNSHDIFTDKNTVE